MPEISVIIPAYNEEASIKQVVTELRQYLTDQKTNFEMIVVDDCSTDDTVKQIPEGVIVEHHRINKGYGASIKSGVQLAKSPWLLLYDADNQFYANEIGKILVKKQSHHHHMIVGQRIGQTSKYRAPGKFLLNRFASFLIKKEIPDINCGLRLVKKSVFNKFVDLYPSGFSITSTMTMALLTNDYDVCWVPIEWKPRNTGKSTMKVFKDGWGFMHLITRLTMLFAPSRITTPIGVGLCLVGVLYALFTLSTEMNIGDFSSLTLISSVYIFLLGMIAEMLVTMRKKGRMDMEDN